MLSEFGEEGLLACPEEVEEAADMVVDVDVTVDNDDDCEVVDKVCVGDDELTEDEEEVEEDTVQFSKQKSKGEMNVRCQ